MGALMRKLLLLDYWAQYHGGFLNKVFGIPKASRVHMGYRPKFSISAILGANIAAAPRGCWLCKSTLAIWFRNINHCEDAAADEGLAHVTVQVDILNPET